MCMMNMTTGVILYWPALSIEIFVSLLYCKSPNINMAFSSLLTLCSARPRLRMSLNLQWKQSRVSTGRVWIDFGLCRWWSDGQQWHSGVCTASMTSLVKTWSCGCQMKYTSTPLWWPHPSIRAAVTSDCMELCERCRGCSGLGKG